MQLSCILVYLKLIHSCIEESMQYVAGLKPLLLKVNLSFMNEFAYNLRGFQRTTLFYLYLNLSVM